MFDGICICKSFTVLASVFIVLLRILKSAQILPRIITMLAIHLWRDNVVLRFVRSALWSRVGFLCRSQGTRAKPNMWKNWWWLMSKSSHYKTNNWEIWAAFGLLNEYNAHIHSCAFESSKLLARWIPKVFKMCIRWHSDCYGIHQCYAIPTATASPLDFHSPATARSCRIPEGTTYSEKGNKVFFERHGDGITSTWLWLPEARGQRPAARGQGPGHWPGNIGRVQRRAVGGYCGRSVFSAILSFFFSYKTSPIAYRHQLSLSVRTMGQITESYRL